jgi:hypothetical protein
VQSALLDEPRRCGDTAASSALVELVAVPPHEVVPPAQSTRAPAWETLTGPETCEPEPLAVAPRSSMLVSLSAEHVPPAPCAAHEAEPELSRTPRMSPDATPVVADLAVPVQAAPVQSTDEPALLDATSVTVSAVVAVEARSSDQPLRPLPVWAVVFEVESAEQPPAVAEQDEEPLVVRTAGVLPVPLVTVAFVVVAPLPEQPAAPSHSILAAARAHPADSPPPESSVLLSAPLLVAQPPAVTEHWAEPVVLWVIVRPAGFAAVADLAAVTCLVVLLVVKPVLLDDVPEHPVAPCSHCTPASARG